MTMATDLQNLLTRRSAIFAELAGLAGTSGDSANVNGGGIGTVDHTGKIESLYREIENLNKAIAIAQGPFQLATRGRA